MAGYQYDTKAYISQEYGTPIRGKTNIIVSDSEYIRCGKQICKAYTDIADAVDSYIFELQMVADTIIVSGEIHDALIQYIALFSGVSKKIIEIGEEYKRLCTSFIEEIEDVDKEMYEKGCDPRVFTDDRIGDFMYAVDDARGFFNGLFDNWMGNAYETMMYYGYKFATKFGGSTTSKTARQIIMDYLDYDKTDVKNIQKAVIAKDKEYADKFAELYDCYSDILVIVQKASAIVNNSESFTSVGVQSIRNDLSKIEITDHLIGENDHVITIENVDEYCANEENRTIYIGHHNELEAANKDINIVDAVVAGVIIAPSSAYAELIDRYSVPEEIPSSDIYEYLLIKKSLTETIAEVADNELAVDEYLNDIEKMKKLLKVLETGDAGNGNDFYSALMEAIDKGKKITGYAGDFMEIILPLLWDYTRNIEVIESLNNGMSPDSYMAIAIREIKAEYQCAFILSIEDLVNKIMKEAVGKTGSALRDLALACIENSSEANLYLFLADKAIEFSGLEEIGNATAEFQALVDQNEELEKAYEYNFAVIQSGDYTEQDVENLNNSLNILKDHYKKQYELLIKIHGKKGNHDLKRHYQEMLEQLNAY